MGNYIEQAINNPMVTWPQTTVVPPLEQYALPVEACIAHLASVLDDRLAIDGEIPHYQITFVGMWQSSYQLAVTLDQVSRGHAEAALALFDEMGTHTCNLGPHLWEMVNIGFLYAGRDNYSQHIGEAH